MGNIVNKIKRGIFLAFIFGGFYACSPKAVQEVKVVDQSNLLENIEFSKKYISVKGDVQPFNTEIVIDTLGDNRYLINLSLYTDFPSSLPKFELDVKYPRNRIHSLWSSRTWSNMSYINLPNYSRLQSNYNIVAAITQDSRNRISFATNDNFNGQYTQIDVKELGDSVMFSFNFFQDAVPDAELLEYKAQVLVDLADKQFSNVIRETSQWRLDQELNKVITKVDISLMPVYSTWYPMDKNVPLENVTHYFDSISAMGFRSLLFDDGWQNVVRFEVDTSGRWDPSQITIVKQFVDKVKETDMKVALWYSQPFIGAHNYVFKKFDGKYLQYRTSSQPILDIRYPEVRSYLAQMYGSIAGEWNIDGIWFNFLNGYYPNEQIIVTEDTGRDFVSVRKALDSLRTYMAGEMMYSQPDIMINQSYPAVGPLHSSNTKTINGFLGTTVLNDVREKMVNNRLMYGEYSPFMEVMGIHPKDPAVDVARKFQSIMFSTPYISYFSYTLPEEVRKTLKFWIQYWKSNENHLLEGDFSAYKPVLRYPAILAGDEVKQVLAVYGQIEPFDFGYFDFEMADVINSSNLSYLAIKGTPTGKVDYIIYNHKGEYQDRGTLKFKADVATIEIPECGFARLIVK